jgi:hypothetical protein
MRARFVAAIVMAGVLAACGSSDREQRDDAQTAIYEPGLGGRGTLIRPGVDPNAIYSSAMDLKAKGDCASATAKLRPIANLGPGYENAQAALGECLTQTNDQKPDQKEVPSDYLEGLAWLRRAADAGWPEAQGRLALLYAFGPGTLHNGEEAAYWLALYDANGNKARVSFVPMDAPTLKRVRDALTEEEKSVGDQRATQWQRRVWIPPPPPPGANMDRRGRRGPAGVMRRDEVTP